MNKVTQSTIFFITDRSLKTRRILRDLNNFKCFIWLVLATIADVPCVVCEFCRFTITSILTMTFFQVLLIFDLNGMHLCPPVLGKINHSLGPDRPNE